MKTISRILCLFILVSLARLSTAQQIKGETYLLRAPSVSATQICFAYAGDIWVTDRQGKNPYRLTIHPGIESNPHFSPDGRWIAFTGEYDGNVDVFVVAARGGSPTRLTFHSGDDACECGPLPHRP